MSLKGIARVTDSIATGHGCDSTSTISGHSSTVYAEGKLVSRKTDAITVHNKPSGDNCVPHSVTISGSSSSVYVEGLLVARQSDSVDNGSITGCASTVLAG